MEEVNPDSKEMASDTPRANDVQSKMVEKEVDILDAAMIPTSPEVFITTSTIVNTQESQPIEYIEPLEGGPINIMDEGKKDAQPQPI